MTCNVSGIRLDVFLAKHSSEYPSRKMFQGLIRRGLVFVDNTRAKPSLRLKTGQRVRFEWENVVSLPVSRDSVNILFEDDVLLVVDKPAGVLVHPRGRIPEDSIVTRLWPKLELGWATKKNEGSPWRPGVVHRLDRGTSGILLIAKTPKASENLSQQFASRAVEKIYWTIVSGIPARSEAEIEASIGGSPRIQNRRHKNRIQQSVTGSGRWSLTRYKVLESWNEFSWLEVKPVTGRTHQIRVILSSLGHPIVGDQLYGSPSSGYTRPLLHARSAAFIHPVKGNRLCFESPLPDDFKEALETFRRRAKEKRKKVS